MLISICMAFPMALLIIFLVLKICFSRRPNHIDSLIGKHVVITGGSSGIGFAVAKRCLTEGAFVTLLSRTDANLVKALDTLIEAVDCSADRILLKAVDVSDRAAVSVAIEEAFRWRPIDILICNAGVARIGPFDVVTVEDLELVTRTNLLGCVYPVHAVVPLMKKRSLLSPSSIVFMNSMVGLAPLFGANMYMATKIGQKGLAEILSLELTPHNIRVSMVCPDLTDTPMLDEADKIKPSSRFFGKFSTFDFRAYAQSADHVASKCMQGVKQGDFLITTSFNGFLLSILGRGVMPAESFTTAMLELILLVPARILSFVAYGYIRKCLHNQHLKRLRRMRSNGVPSRSNGIPSHSGIPS